MEDEKLNISDPGPGETPIQVDTPVDQKSWFQKIMENEKLVKALRIVLWTLASALTILFVFVFKIGRAHV